MADERDSGSGEYLDDEPTRVISRRATEAQDEHGALYERLVEAMQLNASAVELLVSDLLVQVGATPARLTPAQLWDMRTGLFDLVDGALPSATRETARTGLLTLMLSVAPLLPASSG